MNTRAADETSSTSAGPQLVCWKVWGGNGQMEAPVAIPGLRGFLYSRPSGSEQGGDVYYLSACGSGALARLCVADVTGHGQSVATFSGWLEEVFSKHIHRASPSGVLREVNRRAVERGLELMSTAVCLSYNSLNGKLAFCSAGHPPVRICRAGESAWKPLRVEDGAGLCNVPLAVDASATYAISRCQLRPGDRLIVHTDGLTEAQDANGQLLGEAVWAAGRVPGCDAPLESVLEAIKAAVAEHVPGGAAGDDITVLVLEALPYQSSNRYALFLKNNFPRFARALLGEGRGGG
ncbi:MAG: serine/threonine-protein phosphatase [Candidatus Hydrogenedentes bacterium]|nr:serine/threonine-protein phosphatase [Candidatus Hydrogenedentota bacterium]